jgi:hypothetical protein
MGQNFVACDRGQTFLLPPSLMDWLPEDHLVWTVLGAVEEMNLDVFYGAYQANGQGRAAYDPSMVAPRRTSCMAMLVAMSYPSSCGPRRGARRRCARPSERSRPNALSGGSSRTQMVRAGTRRSRRGPESHCRWTRPRS